MGYNENRIKLKEDHPMKEMKRFLALLSVVLLLSLVAIPFAQTPGVINGHVTLTADGTPVAMHPVFILKVQSDYTMPDTVLTFTNANGDYSQIVAPGTYVVKQGDEFNYEPFADTVTVGDAQTVTVDIALVPLTFNSAITGTVTFKGNPVAGVTVYMLPVNKGKVISNMPWDSLNPPYQATTDENGQFFRGVRPGEYLVRVPGSNEYLDWNAFVTVNENDTVNVEIALQEFRLLSGNVTNVDDYKWLYVTAHSLNTGRIFVGIPDTNGDYTIKLVPNDTYIVRADGVVNVEGHFALVTLFYDNEILVFNADPVEVGDQDVTGIDFNMPAIGDLRDYTITGTVTDEATGAPLAGVHVGFVSYTARHNFYNSLFAVTDTNGNYSYTGKTFLEADSVIGFAYKNGYYVEFYNEQPTPYTANPINITADSVITDVNFTLMPVPKDTLYSISGTVLGEDGEVPPFAQVIAYSTVGIKYADIDSSGHYKLTGFPDGTTVVLQAWGSFGYIPEFYNDKYSAEEADTLVIHSDRTGIDFVLAKRDLNSAVGKVSGEVTINASLGKKAGSDLTGITLLVRKAGDSEWFSATMPNENGQFELPIETYGTYELKATGPGYEDATVTFEVNEQTGLNPSIEVPLQVTGIEDSGEGVVIKTNKLYNAYPNPFNPSTTIRVDIAQRQEVTLAIYNVLGQRVKVLYQGVLQPGSYKFKWDATNESGATVASGLYFYQLRTPNGIQTKAMVFMM